MLDNGEIEKIEAARCGCCIVVEKNGRSTIEYCKMHENSKLMHSSLTKIGQILDPGESDPVKMSRMLKSISLVQAAALKNI